MAKMTLIGLYNYDNDLFDGLTFPEGIDKSQAVNEILMKSGEFEIMYPNFDFLKLQITAWGLKHQRTFEKWVEALAIDYEPLYNYDRHEEYNDTEQINATDSNSVTGSHDVTQTNTGDVQTDVSAYDSNTFQPKEKSTNNLTNRDAGSNSTTANGETHSGRILGHTAHIFGNIGVTTSSKMLEEYISTQRFNIYEAIADIFVDEFCIPIYF